MTKRPPESPFLLQAQSPSLEVFFVGGGSFALHLLQVFSHYPNLGIQCLLSSSCPPFHPCTTPLSSLELTAPTNILSLLINTAPTPKRFWGIKSSTLPRGFPAPLAALSPLPLPEPAASLPGGAGGGPIQSGERRHMTGPS